MTCFDCENGVYKDGYCLNHWYFLFDKMTNHQRMIAKTALRKARDETK